MRVETRIRATGVLVPVMIIRGVAKQCYLGCRALAFSKKLFECVDVPVREAR